MRAADPLIVAECDLATWPVGSAERQEIEAKRGAARTRAYRVLAAWNGIDVEQHIAPRDGVLVPVVLPRETFGRLQTAILNEAVFAALTTVIGEDNTNILLGEIAAL
jgi:hypothetical protein